MAHRVKLGRSGLDVSPVCYGSWQLSPRFWGKQPEADILDAVRGAFEMGINFYDTADAYGDGSGEELIGRALAPLPRDQVVLATKVYHHFFPDGRRYGDLSREYILQACEASLKRLKMEYIDLYQCHSWDPMAGPDEIAEAMEILKKQGKIRAYGTSNWSVEQMRAGEKFGNFSTCQPRYSLLKREIEEDILPHCHAERTGVLVFSPLERGLLTGKYKGSETFEDFRRDAADFKGERFKALCGRVAQVSAIAADYKMSTVQLIVAATLMHPSIHCAIVGIKRKDQIVEAAGAMGKTISREDWNKVRALLTV